MHTSSPHAWDEAIRSSLDESDVASATRTVAEHWQHYYMTHPELVRSAVQSLPATVWQADPWLLTAVALSHWAASDSSERASAALFFKEAHRLVGLDEDIRVERRLSIELYRAGYRRAQGQFAAASDEVREIWGMLDASTSVDFDERIRIETRLRVEKALIDWHRGDFVRGAANIRPVLAVAEGILDPHEHVKALGVSALFAVMAENYDRVESLVDRAFEITAETADAVGGVPLEQTSVMTPVFFARGLVMLEHADLAGAGAVAPLLARAAAGSEWRVYAQLFDANRLLLAHEADEAVEPLREAKRLMHPWTDARFAEALSTSIGATIDMGLGRLQTLSQAENLHGDTRHVFCAARHDGWRYLGEGRLQEAMDAVAECVRLGDDHARGSLIDVLLIEAIASEGLGDRAHSAQALDYALILSSETGSRRAFHNVPAGMLAPAMSAATTRPHSPAVLALLDELGVDSDRDDSQISQLSDREREILSGLQAGLSNKELCNRLFVSPNTMKTHVRHIYRKLGVTSREEAVLTATRLGITVQRTVA